MVYFVWSVRGDIVMFYSVTRPMQCFDKVFWLTISHRHKARLYRRVSPDQPDLTCDIFRPKTKFIKLSICYGYGRGRVSRQGRQRWWKEEKTRGGWFIDKQQSSLLLISVLYIIFILMIMTLTTGSALQTWSLHGPSGRVWGGQATEQCRLGCSGSGRRTRSGTWRRRRWRWGEGWHLIRGPRPGTTWGEEV